MATDRNEKTRFMTDVNVSASLKADVNAIVHDGGTMREPHCLRHNSFGFVLCIYYGSTVNEGKTNGSTVGEGKTNAGASAAGGGRKGRKLAGLGRGKNARALRIMRLARKRGDVAEENENPMYRKRSVIEMTAPDLDSPWHSGKRAPEKGKSGGVEGVGGGNGRDGGIGGIGGGGGDVISEGVESKRPDLMIVRGNNEERGNSVDTTEMQRVGEEKHAEDVELPERQRSVEELDSSWPSNEEEVVLDRRNPMHRKRSSMKLTAPGLESPWHNGRDAPGKGKSTDGIDDGKGGGNDGGAGGDAEMNQPDLTIELDGNRHHALSSGSNYGQTETVLSSV